MQDDTPTWCVECDDSVVNCTCWNSKRIKELEVDLKWATTIIVYSEGMIVNHDKRIAQRMKLKHKLAQY